MGKCVDGPTADITKKEHQAQTQEPACRKIKVTVDTKL